MHPDGEAEEEGVQEEDLCTQAKPQQRNFECKGIIYRNTALKIFLDLSEHEEKVAASGAGVQKLNVQL